MAGVAGCGGVGWCGVGVFGTAWCVTEEEPQDFRVLGPFFVPTKRLVKLTI